MEDPFLKKQPRQSRSRAVVSALVSAFDQLLERTEDLSGISVHRVAERAGVGIGSLYDYFTSRENLFGEFLVRLTDENFVKLQAAVEATNDVDLGETVERLIDATCEVYLARPRRTRGAITIIARLGLMKPVLAERDRFAAVIATRILRSHPALDRARVEAVCVTVCDAVMGVVMAELWRPTSDVCERMRAVTRSLLRQELGLPL